MGEEGAGVGGRDGIESSPIARSRAVGDRAAARRRSALSAANAGSIGLKSGE